MSTTTDVFHVNVEKQGRKFVATVVDDGDTPQQFTGGKLVVVNQAFDALRAAAKDRGGLVLAHYTDDSSDHWSEIHSDGTTKPVDPPVLEVTDDDEDRLDEYVMNDGLTEPPAQETSENPRPHTGTAHGPIILAGYLPPPAPDRGKSTQVMEEIARVRKDVARQHATPTPDPRMVLAAPTLPAVAAAARPTVDELMGIDDTQRVLPAQEGWRALLNLPPGKAELARRADIAQIKGLPGGCWTVVVVNPKGGVGKTTATRQIAATFARNLVSPTIAWDNNPSRGNLGSRVQVRPSSTVLDLLRDLPDLDRADAQFSALAKYARLQPEGYYALASARRTAGMHAINGIQFDQVHEFMDRFARVLVVDTGNDETSQSWQAAARYADQLVIVLEAAQDAAEGAIEMMEDLRQSAAAHLVGSAVTVVSGRASVGGRDRRKFVRRVKDYLDGETRVVLDVPFDRALDGGGKIEQADLTRATERAWERVTAEIVNGFHARRQHQVDLDTELDGL